MRVRSVMVPVLVIGCAVSCASQSAPVREADFQVAEPCDGVASKIFDLPIDEDGLEPDVAGGHPLVAWVEGALRELARCEVRGGE